MVPFFRLIKPTGREKVNLDRIRNDIVLALLWKLSKKTRLPITEKKIQKLVFLALYIGKNGFFEEEGLRKIFDDYRIIWHGVFSGLLRDTLTKLSFEEKIFIIRDETATDIILADLDGAKKAYDKLNDLLKQKIDWVVEVYGDKTGDELEELINKIFGIEGSEAGSLKALVFGSRVEDLIMAAKVYASGKQEKASI